MFLCMLFQKQVMVCMSKSSIICNNCISTFKNVRASDACLYPFTIPYRKLNHFSLPPPPSISSCCSPLPLFILITSTFFSPFSSYTPMLCFYLLSLTLSPFHLSFLPITPHIAQYFPRPPSLEGCATCKYSYNSSIISPIA